MSDFWDLADAMVTSLSTITGLLFTLAFQPLPQVIYSKSATTGGNVLGLDRFTGDFINALAVVSWALPTDNTTVYAAVQQLFEDAVAKAKSTGVWNEFIYLNYAASWQKLITSYGQANKNFLQSVGKKYDPNSMFQKAVPGGFKLATP